MNNQVKRNFHIGSEWVYFKIYGSPIFLENFLSQYIWKIVTYLGRNMMIDRFFYVWYTDPDFHLRIRFRITEQKFLYDIIILLNNVIEKKSSSRELSKIMLDTYSREIERYGDKSIEDVEQLFYFDSMLILDNMRFNFSRENIEENKWLLALKVVDNYFKLFDVDLIDRVKLIKNVIFHFKNEFNIRSPQYTKVLAKDYNANKALYKEFLFNSNRLSMGSRIELKYYKKQILTFKSLRDNLNKNAEKISANDLMTSLIHMSVNRIFPTDARFCEMVLYENLLKVYNELIYMHKNDPLIS